MIQAAEDEGRIEPGRSTIVEATSGNTGIALAFVCAAKGYDLVLTLPQGMSREREGLLRLYGATGRGRRVARRHGRGGQRGAGDGPARRRLPARPVLQSRQPRGAPAHDGPELWEQLDGKVDYLVCGVGTGGTVTGAGSSSSTATPG
jgi:cysteine synthase A